MNSYIDHIYWNFTKLCFISITFLWIPYDFSVFKMMLFAIRLHLSSFPVEKT
jgi:hypothetical protein